jgi:hypothetical protein
MFSVETMFTQDLDGLFDKMVDTVYKETSQHLLNVLHSKYKFMDHLKVYICQLLFIDCMISRCFEDH